jgi:magnesium transporter
MGEWIDLVDPTPEELTDRAPEALHPTAVTRLLAPARHDDEPRPTIEAHGDYVFAILLVAVAVPEENRVFYQEIDLVLTEHTFLLVRKTPEGEAPFDSSEARDACRPGDTTGTFMYRLVDVVAERYLDLVDALNDEIDELEDGVEGFSAEHVRARLSELRHDILHIRRTLGPTRDAVRGVVDNRIEIDDGELFPHDVELAFGAAYDKLLRATDGLELSRDLIAGVRDYSQAKIANDQNEVMKRLTVVASLLLLPTFIVGLYGQNFEHHFPEIHWQLGYLWSWALIVVTTLAQLAYFRRKRWI